MSEFNQSAFNEDLSIGNEMKEYKQQSINQLLDQIIEKNINIPITGEKVKELIVEEKEKKGSLLKQKKEAKRHFNKIFGNLELLLEEEEDDDDGGDVDIDIDVDEETINIVDEVKDNVVDRVIELSNNVNVEENLSELNDLVLTLPRKPRRLIAGIILTFVPLFLGLGLATAIILIISKEKK